MQHSPTSRLGLTDKQLKAKDATLRRMYNISLEEFISILDFQGWKCPICQAEYQPGRLWAVDHEHRSGLSGPVRGICCFRCNRYKIGKLTAREAERINKYMQEPPAVFVLGGERIASPKRTQRKRRQRRRKSVSSRTL
jgi:hypothetical protein